MASADQEQEVQRYLKIKDFYELLGVSKDVNDADLKKAYRKAALKFHPDKNKHPKAGDVFKKFAQAYDCLSNPDKRANYDRYGPDQPEQQQRQQYYREDIDPNDIFDFIFGQGFFNQAGGGHARHYEDPRNGGVFFQFGGNQRARRQQNGAQNGQAQGNNFMQLLQLLPLFLIMFSGVFTNLMKEDPVYSMSRTYSYTDRRTTSNLQVPYFTGQAYVKKQREYNFVKNLDYEIETQHVKSLRQECSTAQQYRKLYTDQAARQRNARDKDYYNRLAGQVNFSPCEQLDTYRNKIKNFDRVYY